MAFGHRILVEPHYQSQVRSPAIYYPNEADKNTGNVKMTSSRLHKQIVPNTENTVLAVCYRRTSDPLDHSPSNSLATPLLQSGILKAVSVFLHLASLCF